MLVQHRTMLAVVSSLCLVVSAARAQTIYWTDGSAVMRAHVDGVASPEVLLNATPPGNLIAPRGVAVDVVGGMMYLVDQGAARIRRADLPGFNDRDVAANLTGPMGVALDTHSSPKKLYWTDPAAGTINRCDLDGSNEETLLTSATGPRYIALDVAGGMMYWSQSDGIHRATLDGQNVETLAAPVSDPRGIALDLRSSPSKVYWTEAGTGEIRRANLDGSGNEVVIGALSTPTGIVLDLDPVDLCDADVDCAVGACGDYDSGLPGICNVRQTPLVYWAEAGSGKIRRAALDGSGVSDVVTGLGAPEGLAMLASVTFKDVATTAFPAGLDLNHGMPANMAEGMAAGACAGDFNNDGAMDLYYARMGVPNLLFKNNGDGTFDEVGASMGVDLVAASGSCTWADIDGDGNLDLYVQTWCVSNENCPSFIGNKLYMNVPGQPFVESADLAGIDMLGSRRSASASFGDYNNDGMLDLHVVEWDGQGECPDTGPFPDSWTRLFRNDGGTFTDVTEDIACMASVYGWSTSFADANNDGWQDLLVVGDFGGTPIFVGAGSKLFTYDPVLGIFVDETDAAGVGLDQNGMGSAIGDMDNDGDLDWFVTSIFEELEQGQCPGACTSYCCEGNKLYRNDTVGDAASFTELSVERGVDNGNWGWGASFFDYDNDGDLDLGHANGMQRPDLPQFWDSPLRLWENDLTQDVMADVGAQCHFTDNRFGKGFVVFDYDNDGDEDVFIVNSMDTPVLYRNDGGNANPWLRVRLEGVQTNRFGVGARVYVQVAVDGPEQMREVNIRSNYMSHNEVIAHFGLGSGVTNIYSVRVAWPRISDAGGRVQEFRDVSPNQILTINENDIDGDGRIDFRDFQAMQLCFAGSGNPPSANCPAGASADLDADGDVDIDDYSAFRAATAP